MRVRELKVSRSKEARRLAGVRIEWPGSQYVAWRMNRGGLPAKTVRGK